MDVDPRLLDKFILMTKHILVVDNSQAVVTGFRKIFKGEKFYVCAASRKEQIMKLLKSKNIALIFFDMNKYQIEGIRLFKIIKLLFPNIPIIAMTAYGNIFTAKNAIDIGADAYLTKPFDIPEMLQTVHKLTGSQPATHLSTISLEVPL